MKILAVDTSSKICSVAILEDDNVLLEKSTDDEKTHSQNLMPLIDELFKETNLSLENIDLLACCQGPGSFTGIRIGIATMIYEEIIVIRLCGLEKDVREEIINRASLDHGNAENLLGDNSYFPIEPQTIN